MKAYVNGLYGDAAQALMAKHFFRPAKATFDTVLPAMSDTQMVNIGDLGGFGMQCRRSISPKAVCPTGAACAPGKRADDARDPVSFAAK